MSSGWQITIWRSECIRIFSSFSGYHVILYETDTLIFMYLDKCYLHQNTDAYVNRLFMHIWIEVYSIRKVILQGIYTRLLLSSTGITWKKRSLGKGFIGMVNELLSVRVVSYSKYRSIPRNGTTIIYGIMSSW